MSLRSFDPRRVALIAVALVSSCAIPGQASAQGFFEQLFGGFSKPAPVRGGLSTPGGRAYPPAFGSSPFSTPVHRPVTDADNPDGSRKYRTVCVRLCDGYYWPMSFATTRGRFSAEQGRCKSSCGEEARLFFYPANGGAVESMEDLSGRLYGALPTAFKYRKKLVAGCQCKPEPWQDAELARHENYAAAERPARVATDVDTGPPPRTVAALMADAKRQEAGGPETKPAAAANPFAASIRVAAADQPPIESVPPASTRAAKAAAAPARTASRRRTRSPQVQTASYQGQGGWGLTKQPQYSWPGDAPRRR